jgi:hypothetical protein
MSSGYCLPRSYHDAAGHDRRTRSHWQLECKLLVQLVRPDIQPTFADHCLIGLVIFSGDSYTQTGFNISTGPLPSVGNPLGNPPYPVRFRTLHTWIGIDAEDLSHLYTGLHRRGGHELD